MTIPKALASAATGVGVGMIGGTSGSELIHGRFQRVHGGDQLCVCRGGAGEADDADPAAGTDLPVLSAVRWIGSDIRSGCKGNA